MFFIANFLKSPICQCYFFNPRIALNLYVQTVLKERPGKVHVLILSLTQALLLFCSIRNTCYLLFSSTIAVVSLPGLVTLTICLKRSIQLKQLQNKTFI